MGLNTDIIRTLVTSTETKIPKFEVPVPSIPTHIVESESMKAILDFLKKEEEGIEVRVVGIYGEGGMGKTTLLNWTVVQLWEQTNSMVIPYVEVGQNPDLDKLMSLQSSIAQQLGSSEIKLQSIYHGQTLIKQQLDKVREGNKKVCLAIDHVWEEEDLTKLLPSNLGSYLPSSSCILLTTRFLNVVEKLDEISKPQTLASPGIQSRCKFWYYNMLQLSEEDATQLFRKRASLSDGHHQELVNKVVRRCGGLPLLLEVLGAHFSTESKRSHWKEFVEKMDSTNERPKSVKKVEEVLQYSYDWLSPDTQKAFVDVARYFHEWDWDTVRRIVGNDEIEELKNSCLLKQVNSTSWIYSICKERTWPIPNSAKSGKCTVKMHDLVLSLGRSLAARNRLQTDAENGSFEEYADSDLHQIEGFWQGTGQVIEADVLGKMQNLRVLRTRIDDPFPPLRSLRYLDLHCNGGAWEMPIGKCQHLSVMSLRSLAWDFSRAHFPSHLRQLHLHGCHGLVELPTDSFKMLEVLHLHGCRLLQRISVTIGNLGRLLELEIMDAPSFVELSPSIFKDLGELKVLHLRNCLQLTNLPDVKWNLKSLTSLCFEGCRKLTVISLPIGELSSLEVLSLQDMEHLEISPFDLLELHGLRKLSFAGCKKIKGLLETLGKLSSLENLTSLHLEGNIDEALFTNLGKATALKELSLRDDTGGHDSHRALNAISSGLASLTSLELRWGSISGTEEKLDLPLELWRHTNLERLRLEGIAGLEEIPAAAISSLGKLWELEIKECKNLRKLPDNLFSCPSLEFLDLRNCGSVTVLPAIPSGGVMLVRLSLWGCTNLTSLSLDLCHSASRLKVVDFGGSTTFPVEDDDVEEVTKGYASTTKWATFVNCPAASVSSFWNSLSGANMLETLYLDQIADLQVFPPQIQHFSNLYSLQLHACKALVSLSPQIGLLKKLQDLWITWCTSLQELPSQISQLVSLEDLRLTGCTRLTHLPPTLHQITSLQALNLEWCVGLSREEKNVDLRAPWIKVTEDSETTKRRRLWRKSGRVVLACRRLELDLLERQNSSL